MSAPAWPTYPLSVKQFIRMAEVGVLDCEERLELLDGVLVPMSPTGPPHASTVTRIAELIRRAIPDGWHVREEKPLWCDAHSLPYPDIVLVRGLIDEFVDRHPAGSQTAIVIEVAFSSQDRDHAKASLYARAGAPHYGLLDLPAGEFVLHGNPSDTGYKDRVTLDAASALSLEDPRLSIRVAALLGPLPQK